MNLLSYKLLLRIEYLHECRYKWPVALYCMSGCRLLSVHPACMVIHLVMRDVRSWPNGCCPAAMHCRSWGEYIQLYAQLRLISVSFVEIFIKWITKQCWMCIIVEKFYVSRALACCVCTRLDGTRYTLKGAMVVAEALRDHCKQLSYVRWVFTLIVNHLFSSA